MAEKKQLLVIKMMRATMRDTHKPKTRAEKREKER